MTHTTLSTILYVSACIAGLGAGFIIAVLRGKERSQQEDPVQKTDVHH